jgi:hypothetical protein
MTEDTFVQLFWAIAIPVAFGALLVLGGAAHHLFISAETRKFLRLQKAKRAWEKMLVGADHEKT